MHNTSKQTSVHGALAAILVLTLSACGGGGGGGSNAPPPTSGPPPPPPNAPPVIGALALTTKEGTDLTGQVTATDPTGDALTFTVAANPTGGTIVSFSASGAFVYRPTAGFTGDDSFRVQVADAAGNAVQNAVTINVHPNRVPVATNDAMRADGPALASLKVLANDTDADADPLTVTITEQALVGTATVNPDSTVSLGAMPGDFKGVTRFKYQVTDSSGASSPVATVAIFVGTEPFRVVFAGDPAANGSTEIFMGDFVTDASALTTATEGTMRLKGFAVSENGATVAYRREDSATPSKMDLSFVHMGQKSVVPLPVGATLPPFVSHSLDPNHGKDQFIVSPDGQWIALVARDPNNNADSVCVLSVASPATLTKVSPAGTVFASRLRFSRDSKNLYFLASSIPNSGRSLYTVTPASTGAAALVSKLSNPAKSDDVVEYSISADQASILVQADRNGGVGLFFIDARQLQTEVQVNHDLPTGERISESTLTLPGGTIGGSLGGRVGYTTVQVPLGPSKVYAANISSTPEAREIASDNAQVVGLRPDDAALLFSKNGQIYEQDLAPGASAVPVAVGGTAWYDSTINIVLVQQFAGATGYPVLAVTTRGAFGTTRQVGTPAQAARFMGISGFDRGVVVLAEGPSNGSIPTRARLAVVNGLAPDKLLYLSDFNSPLDLTSAPARVVSH
jgi:Bacterial Ig domain